MISAPSSAVHTQTLIYPQLPLAVYREIAAHLSQIQGLTVTFLPQTATGFDYAQSQVGGLELQYPLDLSAQEESFLQEILSYYGQLYGKNNP
jgi:hypothetical protein